MTKTITALPAALFALIALTACATAPDVRPESSSARGPSEAISFTSGAADPLGSSSPGVGARVTRTPLPDGSERLHGETEIALGSRAQRCIVEDVTLDPRGRLAHAEVAVSASCGGAAEWRALLDPASGTVAQAGVRWSAPADAPWIYAPEIIPGKVTVTPVAAWVARRAALASPTLVEVRLDHADAFRVPSDQVAVPTEQGATIVLGGAGADVTAAFVERVRMIDYGITLVRKGAEPRI